MIPLIQVNYRKLTSLILIFIPFQWTVNGQLRVGFFTTKAVTAGTELTFDYQFQRYGYCFYTVIIFHHTCVLCGLLKCFCCMKHKNGSIHIDMFIKSGYLTFKLMIYLGQLFYFFLQQRSTEMFLWSTQLQRLPWWGDQS